VSSGFISPFSAAQALRVQGGLATIQTGVRPLHHAYNAGFAGKQNASCMEASIQISEESLGGQAWVPGSGSSHVVLERVRHEAVMETPGCWRCQ
jgi:hypothetical protein